MVNPVLKTNDATLAAFCLKHHIQRLSLFGSQLGGGARPDSDIDMLVYCPSNDYTKEGLCGRLFPCQSEVFRWY